MERLLAGRYWVVWGFTVREKSGRSGAKWVNRPLFGLPVILQMLLLQIIFQPLSVAVFFKS